MNVSLSGAALHAGTPLVSVYNALGFSVRTLSFLRQSDALTLKPDCLAARQQFGPAGLPVMAFGTRALVGHRPDMTQAYSLSGAALRTDSVDAGCALTWSDAAGRSQWALSAEGVTTTFQYEPATLPGRPLSMTEAPALGTSRVCERLVWGDSCYKAVNLVGAAIRQYDNAGLQYLNCAALGGEVTQQVRTLLRDEQVADWAEGTEAAWAERLETQRHLERSLADTTGAVLAHTNAAGVTQTNRYDLSGTVERIALILPSGKEQAVMAGTTFTAAGAPLSLEHGNGIVERFTYDPKSQRLIQSTAARPAGHPSGSALLQDLRYTHDPVGNITRCDDAAIPTTYWRNQAVSALHQYEYDTLYRLTYATGRELAVTGSTAAVPIPEDGAWTLYSEQYRYDTGDNLTQVRHASALASNNWTRTITVSERSNRASSRAGIAPTEVEALFTPGGAQRELADGRTLGWRADGQLASVTPVARENQADDEETYRYSGLGSRIRKLSTLFTGTTLRQARVTYLSGLEWREVLSDGAVTAQVAVTQVGNLRVISDVTRGETLMRASLTDHLGSAGLETDEAGRLISREEYYPYGGTAGYAARSAMEAADKARRYSGKERDATGLYYYGYRYYQTEVGRWLSADPAGAIDGLNLYRMVRNNPTNLVDSDGLYPKIAHYIWLGDAELPANAVSNIIHFKSNNPDYKVNLWSDSPARLKNRLIERGYSTALFSSVHIKSPTGLSLTLSSAIARESSNTPYANHAAASDILRLAVLEQFGGGLYMDVDVMVNGKLEEIASQRVSSTGPSDVLIHRELWEGKARVSNAVIAASEKASSLKEMIRYATAPYQGELYDMGVDQTAAKDWLKKELGERAKSKYFMHELMWSLKRFIPQVRHKITMLATGPGLIDSWVQASGLSVRLQPTKFIANPEQFGQRGAGPLAGWVRGMNGESSWALTAGGRRASLSSVSA